MIKCKTVFIVEFFLEQEGWVSAGDDVEVYALVSRQGVGVQGLFFLTFVTPAVVWNQAAFL